MRYHNEMGGSWHDAGNQQEYGWSIGEDPIKVGGFC